ncbi:MAG: hypothetical protein IAG10_03755 [Planctomycetaceae bacterium]|nr:hypothetical protein [Planctomycetaceae bacterium]
MPTSEISGGVYEGVNASSGRIDGAVIEVLDGVRAGRTAVSGEPPVLLPGFSSFASAGYYRIVGVPPGTFRVRVV